MKLVRFWLASSTSLFRVASVTAARAWLCSVMSRAMETAPIVVPYSSLTGDTDTDTGKVVPSLRCLTVS